ncbi:D-amino-acid transaminase [Elioraea thermophila]|uniref:D-amino-acid transaminase n=1 Tax=Elioraea thermophila TaxID=2185104 RepID=UPI000DF18A27|nr:D-amino-acid transaminase [Elioraea thermophila]
MSRIAYVNGRYVPHGEAAVHIEDRGYQFADAVYEVVHVHDGRLIDEEPHLDRLERSLREIRIPMPVSRRVLERILREIVRRNRLSEGIVYLQISRGVARRDHAFPKTPVPPALVITAKRLKPYPRSLEGWTATAITHPDQRWARCDIKTVGLLPNVLARQAAVEKGATEAILVAADGTVTEGASTSVWIVDAEKKLRTRDLTANILPGCTRQVLLGLLAENGIAVEEGPFTVDDLRNAREVFLTSASSFVKPVVAIDGRPVGDGKPGPVTQRLFAIFSRHVEGGRNERAAA